MLAAAPHEFHSNGSIAIDTERCKGEESNRSADDSGHDVSFNDRHWCTRTHTRTSPLHAWTPYRGIILQAAENRDTFQRRFPCSISCYELSYADPLSSDKEHTEQTHRYKQNETQNARNDYLNAPHVESFEHVASPARPMPSIPTIALACCVHKSFPAPPEDACPLVVFA